MFNFLSKLNAHKKVEQKIHRIQQKGVNLSHSYVQRGQTTEFGASYGQKGSIKLDDFVADTTRFLSTDLYTIEHKQAIEKYRYISMLPECNDAIEEIVNEAIVMAENDDHSITIDFIGNTIPKEIKDRIVDEFAFVRDVLMDFKNQGHYYFRNWYIDGSIFFEKVLDEDNLRDGILKLNMLDPRFTTYYTVYTDENEVAGTTKQLVGEFFIVKQQKFANRYYRSEGMYSYPSATSEVEGLLNLCVPKDLITYVDSGVYHPSREYPLSYLHKALKVANQLTMLEDSLLVYRITRAPERRVFYIEVGNLPTPAAEAHIQDVMRNYRQEKIYDVNSGSVKDRNAVFAMTEDFFLPRRNGASSTEVTTLAGGQNLDQVQDLDYFARKIWRSLSVPYSRRADKENAGVTYNSGKELSLEELKFYRFIIKLRKQFSRVFQDLLATQLILKRVITAEDIPNILPKIKFVFTNSNYFNDFLKFEVLNSKLDVLNAIDGYVGKYVSQYFVWKEIFGFSDEQIYQEVVRIEREKQGDFLGTGTLVKGSAVSGEEAPEGEEVPEGEEPAEPIDEPDLPEGSPEGGIEQG